MILCSPAATQPCLRALSHDCRFEYGREGHLTPTEVLVAYQRAAGFPGTRWQAAEGEAPTRWPGDKAEGLRFGLLLFALARQGSCTPRPTAVARVIYSSTTLPCRHFPRRTTSIRDEDSPAND